MPRTVGIWSASAGAMMSANRTGVSSGTRSSRGVRMLSANLRRTSVRSALVLPAEAAARALVARGRWSEASMVAMESSSMSGGGQAAAGQAEIDVVERRPAGCELGRGQAELADRDHRGMRRRPVQRDGERAAHGERVLGRDAAGAEHRERGVRVSVDVHLEQLGPERAQERRRRVEGDDSTGVDDRDAVAEPLGLVEVVRREDNRHLVAPPQHRDEIEELVADEGIETDGRLVEEQDLWVREQRSRQFEPPALPPAVAGDRPIDDLAEAEGVDDLVESGPGLRRLDAPQPGVDLEIAPAAQGPVDDRLL